MFELHRVLKPGGQAILQIPYSTTIDNSIEDSEGIATTDEKRSELFGQSDHIRIYTKNDFESRLSSIGFKIKTILPSKDNWPISPKKLGLNPREHLFICQKENI